MKNTEEGDKMDKNLESSNNFIIMYKDIPIAKVQFNSNSVDIEALTSDKELLPPTLFGMSYFFKEKPTKNDLVEFINSRIFPRQRDNCQDLLEAIGINHYDEMAIFKYNHGTSIDDQYWAKWDNENIDYTKLKKILGE